MIVLTCQTSLVFIVIPTSVVDYSMYLEIDKNIILFDLVIFFSEIMFF